MVKLYTQENWMHKNFHSKGILLFCPLPVILWYLYSIKTQIRVSQAPVTAMNSHQLLVAEQTSHNKFHLPHNHRICLNKRNILPVSHSSSSEVGRIMRVDSNRHPKQPSLPPLVS